jgi:hypothetical protein
LTTLPNLKTVGHFLFTTQNFMPQIIYWGDAPYEVPERQEPGWDWVECDDTPPANNDNLPEEF